MSGWPGSQRRSSLRRRSGGAPAERQRVKARRHRGATRNQGSDRNSMQAFPKYILAPYLATPFEVVGRMVEAAGVGADDLVYDIGCGDGRLAIAAAATGASALGVDVEQGWVDIARAQAAAAGVAERVSFERCDAMELDLGPASVVFLYLVEWSTQRMAARVREQCRPGTRIVSHSFGLDGLPGSTTHPFHDAAGGLRRIHCWVHPGVDS
jgi:SAM-dependent methyltransferase